MIALQILDIKDFMSKLLIGAAFDPFWLSEASVTTSITYNLTGSLQPDFFDTEEKEALALDGKKLCPLERCKTLLLFHYEREENTSSL